MLRRMICILLLIAIAMPACGEALLDEWDIVRKVKTRENRYLVNREGKWGIVDGENNLIAPAKYEDILPDENAAVICLDGKYGLMNYDGEILLEPMLRYPPDFSGEYAIAAITSESHTRDFSGVIEHLPIYGVIDRQGSIVVPFEYDQIDMTEDGELLRFEINDRCGYMNLKGEYVIEPDYISIELFTGDYAVATYAADNPNRQNESFDHSYADGVIDRQGNVVIPFEYDTLILDENGLIRARKNEDWGCINLKNEVIVELKYASIHEFVKGYAAAAVRIPLPEDQQDSLDYIPAWGLIDESGREALPFDYSDIEISPDGSIRASLNGETAYFRITADGPVEVTAEEAI